ncbi:ArsR family transcriptional regulator [Actinomadura sp. KC345]|uniref:metalloregulator ArsR/SmtB family transcription factor n=1 Tax=Actinomadura sp. KC345 TaxID=2530371 RepID=UPI00104EB45E|nr:metalloregulator ArsR/SmtB family transcription factor [Actinomadura sp. KC345]TDC52057.1 ArsR family transcriptional regulator [Actinomadura sp. KC345]
MTTNVFEALSDPVRRRLLELVAERERPAGELAAEFDVSRPAVSRHLRVLGEAGLVSWRHQAQQRIYRLEPAALDEVSTWIERTRSNWAARLDAFERHLDEQWEEPS